LIGEANALVTNQETRTMNDVQQAHQSEFRAIAEIRPRGVEAIVMSSQIVVDSRRILQALSVPEYVEAWLQAPSPEEMLTFDFVTQQRFQISLYRAEAFRGSIHGAIRIINRNQVCYMWKTISANGISHTTVDINVLTRMDGEIVTLKHAGFRNPIERAWHRTMWERSFGKLCGLVRAR
jgi:hypothetical protein